MNRRKFAKAALVTAALPAGLFADLKTPPLDETPWYGPTAHVLDARHGDAMMVIQRGRTRIVYDPIAGQDFWKVAREAIRLACEHSSSTFYSFNGCPVLAQPESDPDELYRHYWQHYWQDGERP